MINLTSGILLPYLSHIIHGVELPLYSDNLRLAGTTDLVATFADESGYAIDARPKMFVADYKGSDQPKEMYMLDSYHLF